jgi:hypothetical protein
MLIIASCGDDAADVEPQPEMTKEERRENERQMFEREMRNE